LKTRKAENKEGKSLNGSPEIKENPLDVIMLKKIGIFTLKISTLHLHATQ